MECFRWNKCGTPTIKMTKKKKKSKLKQVSLTTTDASIN